MGYDPIYGARPLKRVIQKQLVDRLALALLKGEIREGDTVTVDAATASWCSRPSTRALPPVRRRKAFAREASEPMRLSRSAR